MEEKPNYYSIIPADVRYDEELKANEKLLYGEITSLTNSNGVCWASNNYFARLYKVENETISRWISNLKNKGYIDVEIKYKNNSKEIEKRLISVKQIPIDEKINTLLIKKSIPIDEKVKENNTSINNTRININSNNNSNDLFSLIEDNFGRTLSPLEIEEVKTWEDNDLTRYAIKETIIKGKCNIKYISRILESYKRNNIKTVQQAKEQEETYKLQTTRRTYKRIQTAEEVDRILEEFLNKED